MFLRNFFAKNELKKKEIIKLLTTFPVIINGYGLLLPNYFGFKINH